MELFQVLAAPADVSGAHQEVLHHQRRGTVLKLTEKILVYTVTLLIEKRYYLILAVR